MFDAVMENEIVAYRNQLEIEVFSSRQSFSGNRWLATMWPPHTIHFGALKREINLRHLLICVVVISLS